MHLHVAAYPLSLPVLMIAWLVCAPLGVADDFQVRVSVYAEHKGAEIVYRYEVRNNGPGEVREFYIGCECAAEDSGTAQLQLLPSGATHGAGRADVSYFDTPPNTVSQPAGWRAQLARAVGADTHWLAWRMPAARVNSGVLARQTLSGFSITVPGEDPAYLQGRYSARVLHNGRYLQITGPLTLLDTSAPTLSLKPIVEKSGNAVSTFRIIALVKDDRDPEPKVILESFERMEHPANPDEREFVLNYSATDASGNRATASTAVRLPAPTAPEPATPPTPIRGGMVQALLTLPRPDLLP